MHQYIASKTVTHASCQHARPASTRCAAPQVWDIAASVHRPAAAHAAADGVALACLAFAPGAPVLVAGSTDGRVAAFRMHGVARPGEAAGAAAARLDAALLANTVGRAPGG